MKNYLSEFIGTSFLLMIVVGSGIMGQNLSNDNSIILLANTVATGSGLINFDMDDGAYFRCSF